MIPRLLILTVLILCFSSVGAKAEALRDSPPPLGIAMENYAYPYPVDYLDLEIEGQDLRMAYMDV